MKLNKLIIKSRFKNIKNIVLDFTEKDGITVLIGNNGSGKSNLIEAISSIFSGLYNNNYNPSFKYELTYSIDEKLIRIDFNGLNYKVYVNDVEENLRIEYLPSQVICSYSGEESRLWSQYYEPFYKEYINSIKGAALPNLKLIYINKFYWNIALLTLLKYDFEVFTDIKKFCNETLNISEVNSIKFSFDIHKINDFLNNPNPVTNFILALNPDKVPIMEYSLEDLKSIVEYLPDIEFFKYLSASSMPKDDKMITDIEIKYNNGISTESLSEGEKKILLIMFILEVIGDEKSLILFDEPDSHIHLSRKRNIQEILSKYNNRENVLTTHSPTLTHSFDLRHITMLTKDENNNASVIAKEKQEIVHELTDGIWNYQEQNIFLNSQNDILLVEGKSDETFLKKALEILKEEDARFTNLNFEYLPCGGAEGVKLMTKKFTPKPGQKIIALFDKDQAGWNSINKIFEREGNQKFSSNNFGKYRQKENIWVSIFPTRSHYRGGDNFNIEDYFSKKLLTKYVLKSFKGLDSIVTKDAVKKALEKDCNNGSIENNEFKHFSKVFELILEIKAE